MKELDGGNGGKKKLEPCKTLVYSDNFTSALNYVLNLTSDKKASIQPMIQTIEICCLIHVNSCGTARTHKSKFQSSLIHKKIDSPAYFFGCVFLSGKAI